MKIFHFITCRNPRNCKLLETIQHTILNLNKENIASSVLSIMNFYDDNYPYYFNMLISQMIYMVYIKRPLDIDILIEFMQEIEKYEKDNKIKSLIFDVFIEYFIPLQKHGLFYIFERFIELKIMDPKILNRFQFPFFMHYNSIYKNLSKYAFTDKGMYENLEEYQKDDWALHKKFIKEGINPNELAKIIRNDDVDKLQVIAAQPNFNFDQEIEPSIYERFEFVNKIDVTLIDFSAYFGAVKCFKYLLLNCSHDTIELGRYAVGGENLEIIHLCEQYHISLKGGYESAIELYHNDIFKYLYENKIVPCNNLENLAIKCIRSHNYDIFKYLMDNGLHITEKIIKETSRDGNLLLYQYFRQNNQIPKDILLYAVESSNFEIVKYIIENDNIDINAKNIYFESFMFLFINLDFIIIFAI